MTEHQEYMHRYYETHKHRYKEYQKKYKGKMSWNEFQKFWSDGSRVI